MIQTPVLPLSRLRTSPDGHFLVSESGPFFWMGDTAWELIHRATREEIDHYLANRQQKDFNVVQTVAIAELDGPTQPNAYGECPLIGGDPLAPNLRYFEHVDYVIDQAARYGLYVALLPTWAEWVTPRFHAPLFTTPKQGYAYGHFLGQRYGQRTNVIWILGGDRLPDEAPHGIAVWRAMAKGIADGQHGVTSPDSQTDYSQTLISFHCYETSARWFHYDDWLAFNMFGSYHSAPFEARSFTVVRTDWARANPKPVINGEPCYEDMVLDYKPGNGYFTAYDVRVSAYWSVLAGAFGHTYGHHSIWQWHRPGAPGQMQPRVSWEDALDHPGAYHMMHLRHLMESRPLLGRRAAPDLIAAPSTEPDAHIQATLGAQDRYALVYTPQSQAITVNLDRVQSQSIDAWWFDPRTGQPTFIGQFASTGPRVFTPPAHGPDWVLVLDDSAQGFSPPGTIPTT